MVQGLGLVAEGSGCLIVGGLGFRVLGHFWVAVNTPHP